MLLLRAEAHTPQLDFCMMNLAFQRVLDDVRTNATKEVSWGYKRINATEQMKELAEVLKKNTSVTSLSLHNNNARPEGVRAICEAIKENRSVTLVDLSGNSLEVTALAELLRDSEVNVRLLYLRGNSIDSRGASLIFEALKCNRTLTVVDLSDNKLDGQCALALSDMLSSNKTLLQLGLSRNKLGMEGVLKLASGLGFNHTLNHLDLFSNCSKSDRVQCVFHVLQHNGSIIGCPNIGREVDSICQANLKMHQRVRECVVALIALRLLRRTALNNVPKEVVAMIAFFLLKTRTNFVAWKRLKAK